MYEHRQFSCFCSSLFCPNEFGKGIPSVFFCVDRLVRHSLPLRCSCVQPWNNTFVRVSDREIHTSGSFWGKSNLIESKISYMGCTVARLPSTSLGGFFKMRPPLIDRPKKKKGGGGCLLARNNTSFPYSCTEITETNAIAR